MNAVALNSVSFNLARILGPAAGAVILQTWGTAEVFFVNAATFALFAAVLTRIPSSYGRIEPAGQGGVGGIGDGFRFARRNRTVGTLIVGIGVISVFGLPVIWLAPLMAERIFGNAADTGFILSALGAGAVVGALASGGAAAENKPRVGIVSYFSFALSLAVFAFAPHPAVALPAIAVFGASYMGAAVVINSLVQLATPDGLRGRVMSLYMIAWVGLLPAGAVIAGGLAEVVGVRWGGPVALAAGASVCFLFALRLLLWRDWVPGRFGEARDASPVSE